MVWERNQTLEFSEQTLAYSPVGDANGFVIPEPLESKIRLVLLDLRGVSNPQVELLRQLSIVAAELKSGKRRLAILASDTRTYLSVTDILLFGDKDKYYDWLAHHEFYRKLTDPVPLFTMTKEEMEEISRNGVTLSEIIAELERMEPVTA